MKKRGKVFRISSKMSEEERKKVFQEFSDSETVSHSQTIDVSKYAGKVKFNIDPIAYQEKIRKEWDRDLSSYIQTF